MNNKQNAPTGKTGRQSHYPSRGKATDYQIHQSETNTVEHNLRALPLAIGIIAGAAALIVGFPGWKRSKDIASKLAHDTADDVEMTVREETDILKRNPKLRKDPTLAAKIIKMVDDERFVAACEVGQQKGQRPRIIRKYRGQLVLHSTVSDIYFFAVTGDPVPIVFTIRDIDNLFNLASGCPCLVIGSPTVNDMALAQLKLEKASFIQNQKGRKQ